MQIKHTTKADVEALKHVLDHCDLFPSNYLDDMIAPYLSQEASDNIWFSVVIKDKIVSIAYCSPMQFAEGVYNLYAIGVHQDFQKQGVAIYMIEYLESYLKERSQRILLIETSSTDSQLAARNLYHKLAYVQEATIRDFWEEGDDKIVFYKKL